MTEARISDIIATLEKIKEEVGDVYVFGVGASCGEVSYYHPRLLSYINPSWGTEGDGVIIGEGYVEDTLKTWKI